MADRTDSLTQDVQNVNGQVKQLSASVGERFDAVDSAIREQREYTEFAYTRMDQRFDQMQLSFVRLEAKVDERFGRLERKLDAVIDTRPARRRPKRGR